MVNNHFGEFWTYHFPETLVRLFQMNVKNWSLFEKQKLGNLCIADFGSKSCFEAFVLSLAVRGVISEHVRSKFPMSEKQKQLNKYQHYFLHEKPSKLEVGKWYPNSSHNLHTRSKDAKCVHWARTRWKCSVWKPKTHFWNLMFFHIKVKHCTFSTWNNATRSKCARHCSCVWVQIEQRVEGSCCFFQGSGK